MVSRTICRADLVRLVTIALGASALAAVILPVQFATPVEAKTPGKTYCYYGKCHRVKTIEETQALVGVEETINASHYDDCSRDKYNPCGLTSSGERFHPDRPDNTASPIYPDGTTLLVWSPETERALVVRVNNAGPYWGDRKLDLSRAAAEKLGFEGKGVATLKVRVVKAPEPEEAAYVANRSYRPVPGDIGEYESLQEAQFGMAVALALQASAASPLAPVTTANAFATGPERPEPLVAEAPQSFGRVHVKVAAVQPAVGSVSLGGHARGGALFKTLAQQSNAQSRRQLASLSLDREVRQSQWGVGFVGDDPIVTGSIDKSSDDDGEPSQPVASGTSDGADKAAAAAAVAAEKQRAKERQAVERRETRKQSAEQPSRKSKARAERRSGNSRTVRNEGRSRSRAQAEFAEGSYAPREARPSRSTEQITSLGIRAAASSM